MLESFRLWLWRWLSSEYQNQFIDHLNKESARVERVLREGANGELLAGLREQRANLHEEMKATERRHREMLEAIRSLRRVQSAAPMDTHVATGTASLRREGGGY